MKAVLISIQPKWCVLIASGRKTIEVRKTRPKIETPFKCYIYMTSKGDKPIKEIETPNGFAYVEVDYKMAGKVIGEFVCDEIYVRPANVIYYGKGQEDYLDLLKSACMTEREVLDYMGGQFNRETYFWHVTDLKIYDKPKELGEFYTLGNCEKYDFCNQCKNFHRGQGWLDGSYCDEDSCLDNTRIPVTRAPQSWCYVEELL